MSKYDYLKDDVIDAYVNKKLSIKEICDFFNIKCKYFVEQTIKPFVRTRADGISIIKNKYPEKFKLKESTKEKLREIRLKYIKEHPEKTAWRTSKHNISYPEQCFIKYLSDRGLDKIHNIEREKSFFPYYADFAFNDIHLVVEIDGSQHLNEDRKLSDEKKDTLISSMGWKIIRVTDTVVKENWELLDNLLLNKKYETVESCTRFGIFKEAKVYQKKIRCENGRTIAQNNSSFRQRKTERPDKDTLYELIKKNSFVKLGKKYGVSDKTISKWCKYYGLPFRKKDLK